MKKRWRIVVSVLALVLGLSLIAGYLWMHHSGEEDLHGHRIIAEDPPSDDEIRDMDAQDTKGRFVIKKVGMDVPLASIKAHGVINPPGFTKAFTLRNVGAGSPKKASEGTLYVAMHSVKRGFAPGNYFIDVGKEYSKVKKGYTVEVSGVEYRVTENRQVRKNKLRHDSEVWANTPNRLVIITCIQRPWGFGSSSYNLVTTAELVEA